MAIPLRGPITTKGNRHPQDTPWATRKGQGPHSPHVQKSLRRSILLLRRLGGYCRGPILGYPKRSSKWSSTLIQPSSQERTYSSNRPPGARAPPRLTFGSGAPSRPTPQARLLTEARAVANHYRPESTTQGQTSGIVQGEVMSQHDPFGRPHDMSFQGTHIAHSDGRVVTLLPTPCTAADQHAGLPRGAGWDAMTR